MSFVRSKSVLVISFSDLASDPRVDRQLDYFVKQGFDVSALGESAPRYDSVRFFSSAGYPHKRFQRPLKAMKWLFRQYDSSYWKNPRIKHCLPLMEGQAFDLIVANDIDALPLALHIANGAKVLFDAHEYAPREFEDQWRWRLFSQKYRTFLCRENIPKADAMITVCEGIAKEYENNFHQPVSVITNATVFSDLQPKKVISDKIRMIYHGIAAATRGVEWAVEIMAFLGERFYLDMILIPGDEKYIEEIKALAQPNPKIRFLPPVPMKEIPKFCNQYDIGLFPLKPSNFNYYHALPNKFFEFIQGRIAPVITPLPEMANFIKRYSCGVVADDFKPRTLAEQLNTLNTEVIWEMKQNAHKAAKDLCAEKNLEIFDNIVTKLLAG